MTLIDRLLRWLGWRREDRSTPDAGDEDTWHDWLYGPTDDITTLDPRPSTLTPRSSTPQFPSPARVLDFIMRRLLYLDHGSY